MIKLDNLLDIKREFENGVKDWITNEVFEWAKIFFDLEGISQYQIDFDKLYKEKVLEIKIFLPIFDLWTPIRIAADKIGEEYAAEDFKKDSELIQFMKFFTFSKEGIE